MNIRNIKLMVLGRLHVAKKRRTNARTIPFGLSKTCLRQAKRDISPSTEQDFAQSTELVHTSNLALTSISMRSYLWWKYRFLELEYRPEASANMRNRSESTLLNRIEFRIKPFKTPSRAPPNYLHTPKLLLSRMFRSYRRPNVPLLQPTISKSNQLGQRCMSNENPWSKCCCENCDPWTITLGDLLEHCFLFGPRYRLTDVYLGVVWRFLNIREYGNNNQKEKEREDQLALRYDDYFNSKVEAASLSLLPNPFNKGEAWEVSHVAAPLWLQILILRTERSCWIDLGR